jgi:hypothetical protein
MSAFDLIQDLERKLGLYKQFHENCEITPNPIHKIVAKLICDAEIYPRLLDRDTVKGLIEEREPWPSSDGGDYCLARAVSLDELEQARIVRFPHDDLRLAGSTHVEPDMPEKLRDQLNAYCYLYDIKFLRGPLVTPHLRIPANKVSESKKLFIEEYLEEDGDHYRIKLDYDDVYGVGTYLWPLLQELHDSSDAAFANYASRMHLVHGDDGVFHIEHEDSETYLQAALNYILADSTLDQNWKECSLDIALLHHRIGSMIESAQRLNSSTSGQETASYRDALDVSALKYYTNHEQNQEHWTLLEKIEWWNQPGYYRTDDLATAHLAWTIIRSERNLYSSASSFPLTRKLIEKSADSPRLVGILFSDNSHPAYQCYLLSEHTTSHIGLISIYRNLQPTARPISKKVDYERKWQDIVWTQALEIYIQSFNVWLDDTTRSACIANTCEMVAWVTSHEFGYNSRHKTISETRLPSLKHVLEALECRVQNGPRERLIIDNLTLVLETIRARLLARAKDGVSPLGEWLMLFWCLEWSKDHANQRNELDLQKISQILISSYQIVIEERTTGKCNSADDPLVLEEFDWSKIFRIASRGDKARLIHLLDNSETAERSEDTKKQRDLVYGARTHLRLLISFLQAATDERDREDLLDAMTLIIKRLGFTRKSSLGSFDYIHDKSDRSPVHLWPTICDTANELKPAEFKRFTKALSECNAPMSALLTLLEKTAPYDYKAQILDILAERNLETEKPTWMPEVLDVIVKATNSGNAEIATYYLGFAKKHAHETFKNRVDELSAKIDLKNIYGNNGIDKSKKAEELIKYQVESDDKQVLKEVQDFKTHLISLINIELDSTKALNGFIRSLETAPSIQSATGVIRTVLEWPEPTQPPAPLEAYFQMWMDTYDNLRPSGTKLQLSDIDLNYILQLCLKVSRLDVFADFWERASSQQRMSYELAPVRVEYLKVTHRRADAEKYLEHLTEIHQGAPQSIFSDLSQLRKSLDENGSMLPARVTQPSMAEIISSQEQLRTIWLNILDRNGYDHSQIFFGPRGSTDDFLNHIMEQVGCELLTRVGNLQRKKEGDTKTTPISIDEENMINDWLTSLVRQRMHFAGWTVYEQARVGYSGSGKSVGETDGLIIDNKKNTIGLIEAFRLGEKLNKATTKEHLDKLVRYNALGMSPIFVIAYTASSDFDELSLSYREYVESIDYHGFDTRGTLEELESPFTRGRTRYYKESRKLNNKDISIFHHLLDFKMK